MGVREKESERRKWVEGLPWESKGYRKRWACCQMYMGHIRAPRLLTRELGSSSVSSGLGVPIQRRNRPEKNQKQKHHLANLLRALNEHRTLLCFFCSLVAHLMKTHANSKATTSILWPLFSTQLTSSWVLEGKYSCLQITYCTFWCNKSIRVNMFQIKTIDE